MPSTAIVCGVLLILIGLTGYIYGSFEGAASVTALIPAFFGIVLAALGFFARANESLRKHLMHGAVLIALLGAIAVIGDFARTGWKFGVSAPVISKVAMVLICLLFVILAIKSFVDARRNSA
jgi:drug/metabolite transporter (DMT)-like permease